MKRKYLFAAVTLVVTSMAVPAGAGSLFENQWEGRAERDPQTYLGFDVIRGGGGKNVARVTAYLGYHCVNGDHFRVYGQLPGRLAVERRRFAGTLRGEFASPRLARGAIDSIRYRVRGRFLRSGRARGRIDAELTFVPAAPPPRGDTRVRCYSGDLDWRARRGGDVSPPIA